MLLRMSVKVSKTSFTVLKDSKRDPDRKKKGGGRHLAVYAHARPLTLEKYSQGQKHGCDVNKLKSIRICLVEGYIDENVFLNEFRLNQIGQKGILCMLNKKKR